MTTPGTLPRPFLPRLAALLFLGVLIFVLLRPYWNIPLGIDSGIFAAIGLHLNHDRVLYRDVWDHKPPLVFFLNAMALRLSGEDPSSIRELQVVFATLNSWVFLAIQLTLFRSLKIALPMSVLFVLTLLSPVLYSGGNFTEEYGVLFVLCGVFCLIRWSGPGRRQSRGWVFLGGVAFGLAVMAKEPFLFSAPAWFLYVLLLGRPGSIHRARDLTCFILGGALPQIAPLIYFLWHDSLDSWIEVIRYGFLYASMNDQDGFLSKQVENLARINELIFSQSILVTLFFFAGVASLSNLRFLRRFRFLPLFMLYWLLLDAFAVQLSGLFFLHYYQQLVPSILCISGFGACFLLLKLRGASLPVKGIGATVLSVALLFDVFQPGRIGDRSAIPSGPAPEDPLLVHLEDRLDPGDLLWTGSGYLSRYYLETGHLSPTKYLAPFSHHLTTAANGKIDRRHIDQIHSDLVERPPRIILHFPEGVSLFREEPFSSWFQRSYRFTPVEMEGYYAIAFEHVEDASLSIREQKKEWASEEAQNSDPSKPTKSQPFRLLLDSVLQSP